MTLNEYQQRAMSTCTQSSNNFNYMMLNLVGEVGELASKIAKGIRKEELVIAENGYVYNQSTTEYNEPLMAEAGDILWQLSGLCNVMGWALEEVAQHNLDKLQARKNAGTIVGNGDGIEREV